MYLVFWPFFETNLIICFCRKISIHLLPNILASGFSVFYTHFLYYVLCPHFLFLKVFTFVLSVFTCLFLCLPRNKFLITLIVSIISVFVDFLKLLTSVIILIISFLYFFLVYIQHINYAFTFQNVLLHCCSIVIFCNCFLLISYITPCIL